MSATDKSQEIMRAIDAAGAQMSPGEYLEFLDELISALEAREQAARDEQDNH